MYCFGKIPSVSMVTKQIVSLVCGLQGECDDDGASGSSNSNKGERKRRHSSDNEDPVEKRKKFLERNR